jgi:hypothetical protein
VWWQNILRTIEVIFVIGGAVCAGVAQQLWIRAQKYQSVAETKDEVIRLLNNSTDAWKVRYEAEHLEHLKYRDNVHLERNETNSRVLALTEQNVALKAKTDLSPILKFQEQQNAFNEKFLAALSAIVERLEDLGLAKRKKLASRRLTCGSAA